MQLTTYFHTICLLWVCDPKPALPIIIIRPSISPSESMQSALQVPVTNPQIAHFIRHLCIVLNISSIVWLYNDDASMPIIDRLIVASNPTPCRCRHTQTQRPALTEWLTALPLGPHYDIIYVVTSWHPSDVNLIQITRNAMSDRTAVRHFVLTVADGRHLPPALQLWHSWTTPDMFERLIVVRFAGHSTAGSEAIITNGGANDGWSIGVTGFLANGSLLADMDENDDGGLLLGKGHADDPAATNPPIRRVLISMFPPDCMNMMMAVNDTDDDAVFLFGRVVAMYRLIAERTQSMLSISVWSKQFRPEIDGFNRKTVRLNLMAGRPLWMRPFVADEDRSDE